MKCKLIAIDLAKSVFQVCGVNKHLTPLFNDKLSRRTFLKFMAKQPATRVFMEACYSSNYWARELVKLGHDVNLIPAQHVKPFVRGNKNDRNDAFAIAEASQRPYIRFVPIKTTHQQEIGCLHRIRERLIKQKTAISNQTRGLLSEFGVIFMPGKAEFLAGLKWFVADEKHSERLRTMMSNMLDEYQTILKRILVLEKELHQFIDLCPNGKILLSIPGIGFINASAILAAIDKGQAFHSPREFAVWLGLTPQQYASGNNSRMGGITKRGDRYLRKQLIHGARTVVCHAQKKTDRLNVWATQLRERKSFNQTVVAMAHRLARLIWILLQRQELYTPQQAPQLAEGC
ncbi:MAG: IS110 family transposase [Psychrobium sp.]|nr:IS110 family transposase [Psychrobium sp.]